LLVVEDRHGERLQSRGAGYLQRVPGLADGAWPDQPPRRAQRERRRHEPDSRRLPVPHLSGGPLPARPVGDLPRPPDRVRPRGAERGLGPGRRRRTLSRAPLALLLALLGAAPVAAAEGAARAGVGGVGAG